MKKALLLLVCALAMSPIWLVASDSFAQRGAMDCNSSGCRPWPNQRQQQRGNRSGMDCDSSGCRPWPNQRQQQRSYQQRGGMDCNSSGCRPYGNPNQYRQNPYRRSGMDCELLRLPALRTPQSISAKLSSGRYGLQLVGLPALAKSARLPGV